ncbi:hypothetical protein BDR06DRAFT_972551 [Suillus hirtellus]|nr:hypothetical protein BDR06DRAFT_972551 [Suillus hirtellus]
MPEVAIIDMESQDCIWEIFSAKTYCLALEGGDILFSPCITLQQITAVHCKHLYLKEYEDHQEQDAVWMGSAMMIDEPNSLSKILGSAQVPILANLIEDMSLKKSKLICGLQKTIKKYIECHCKVGHPTTDLLHKRINAALEGAFLGMEMDNIIISRHISKGGDHKAHGKNKM